ncbi:AI-2E family transporter [Schlegelella sp. S2-27]|uniref:AI-2E family transporter n=1 Tax=Caldimonas mangrovi TaxID=2944811 RepID=A0ABT0YL21_9BURK|nr:AI-2E family transporter [Caldimonas mangrovi]MCM5679410.1 AI-2E family transporter [Caldimonas mangrovi]
MTPSPVNADGWLTRARVQLIALASLTALVLYLCYLITLPFLPALTWAVVLAVIAHPLHERIRDKVHGKSVVAALAVLTVTVALAVPTVLVVREIAQQATEKVEKIRGDPAEKLWSETKQRYPRFVPLMRWAEREMKIREQMTRFSEYVLEGARRFVSGSVYAVVGGLVTLYLLFYFFRDKEKTLSALRRLVPLSPRETEQVLHGVRDTIYAIVYGTLVVALAQGLLGGLMFWWLGLPAPLLWGAVMAFLAILPLLGAAIVWVPAAIALAFEGQWDKALLLTAWGSIVVGLIDNLLYPILVKNRLRLHTVPVFIAVIGGLLVFGSAGVVLGPVVLAVAMALLEVWRRRLALTELPEALPQHPPSDEAAPTASAEATPAKHLADA